MIKVSVIVVKYGQERLVKRCVGSIPKKNDIEVIVVDNTKKNRGFSKGCNKGAKKAKGKYLMFLNPDCEVGKGAIEELVDRIEADEEIGIIGPQLLDENGKAYLSTTRQVDRKSAMVVFSFLNDLIPKSKIVRRYWYKDVSLEKTREVESISGAAMMMRREDFLNLEGFDERFFLYWEDADICRRMRQLGKKIEYYPSAKVKHLKGKSTDEQAYKTLRWFRKSRYLFLKKHFGIGYSLLAETVLTLFEEWPLVLALVIGAFLRFNSLDNLSPLIPDQAHDYLAALNNLDEGRLPLLGIKSSLVRLSQGPVFLWMLMGAFFVFGPSHLAVTYMSSLIGILAVFMIYLVGREWWDKTTGSVAALILATSPLVVIQSRMAFMTSPIPLVSLIFLVALLRLKRKKIWTIILVGLAFGFLYQFELALFPLIMLPIVWLVLPFNKKIPTIKNLLLLSLGVLLGWWPQIVSDLTEKSGQLGGFIVWVGYRLVKYTGLMPGREGGVGTISTAFSNISLYMKRFYGWEELVVIVFLFGLTMVGGYYSVKKRYRSKQSLMVFGWVAILLGAFFIHGSPSEAYFPGLFVPVFLLIGIGVSRQKPLVKKIVLLGVFIVAMINVNTLVSKDYLLYTNNTAGKGTDAYYGLPARNFERMAEFIKEKTNGVPLDLNYVSEEKLPDSIIDPYKFMLVKEGVELGSNGLPVYVLFGKARETRTLPETVIYELEGAIVGISKKEFMNIKNLTVVILYKNEYEDLAELLDRIEFAGEVMVVVDGDDSRIKALVKKYGGKAFYRKMEKGYSEQRNWSIKKCKTEWVMFLDPDERVSEELAAEIGDKIRKDENVDGYALRRIDRFGGKILRYGETGNIWLTRIGRRRSGKFIRPVHETWELDKVKKLESPLLHRPHKTVASFGAKVKKYAKIEADYRVGLGKDFSLFEMIFFPIGKWINNIFLRKGFLDGFEGILMSTMMSVHSFLVRKYTYDRMYGLSENKKREKIWKRLTYLIVILVGLGQLLRIQITSSVAVYWFELLMIVQVSMVVGAEKGRFIKSVFKSRRWLALMLFMLVAILSVFVNYYQETIVTPYLYWVRLVIYSVWWMQLDYGYKKRWINFPARRMLLYLGVTWAIFGLAQYILVPDTRWLYNLGWDDHYYRLIGVLFDPGYMGLFLVLTLWLIDREIFRYRKLAWVIVFVALMLTYARSAYVVLVISFVLRAIERRNVGELAIKLLIVILAILVLPRPGGEGVRLERTNSVSTRAESTMLGGNVWLTKPVLGVGFGAYKHAIGKVEHPLGIPVHANAPDNSFLYILATTGIVGFVVYCWFVFEMFKESGWKFGEVTPLLLIGVHSMTNNSLFYIFSIIWVAFYMSGVGGVIGKTRDNT